MKNCVKLSPGKRYTLWSGDILECVGVEQGRFIDGEPYNKAVCIMREVRRNHFCRATLCSEVFGRTDFCTGRRLSSEEWPSFKVGDRMEYITDGGLYCGWDNRAMPLHVKGITE